MVFRKPTPVRSGDETANGQVGKFRSGHREELVDCPNWEQSMNGKERLTATLNHQQPDRVCLDIGATWISGMHVSVVDKLRKSVLGDPD